MASLDEVDRRLRELIERLRATHWAELAQGHLGDLAPGEPEEGTDVRIRADAAVADLLQIRRML